ncbi:MAG: leucyl aminopeptidase [Psychromonas sp.]|nr:leucyl aminopeptidase [Psychromonas sp.]
MEFLVKNVSPEKQRTACVVIGVFESRRLSSAGEDLNKLSEGYLDALLRKGDIEGKIGQVLLLHHVPNILSERILLVGCGKERELTEKHYKQIIRKTVLTLNDTGAREAICFLSELHVNARDSYWAVRQAIETAHDLNYRFDQFKTHKKNTRRPLRKLTFNVSMRKDLQQAELALRHANAVSSGVSICKDLANMPPNVCTPRYLAKQAQALTMRFDKITTEILDIAQMSELKMNSYLAVAQGSVNPAYMSVIHYNGGTSDQKPVVLVGKGLTFDSGGISLKKPAAMDEMKYDMAGAASVFGTLQAVAELDLAINVIGILAAAENMPSSKAYRPGDILTTMSGQTVEVLNTDAEGRLVLCDALTYAERFTPECVIDIATLTGACISALGHEISALVSPHKGITHELLVASNQSSDKAWQLPMDDKYQDLLKSPFADMANVGGPSAGTITAACFLSRFTKAYIWAHLDIAGTAWVSGKNKGATGRPVSLLTQFIINKTLDKKNDS